MIQGDLTIDSSLLYVVYFILSTNYRFTLIIREMEEFGLEN